MNFSQIPQYSYASYSVDHCLSFLPESVQKYVDEYGLDLNPDFQRAHVWSKLQQSRYVEFLLKGGRSSRDLYFNAKGWMRDFKGPFVIVDGKQRLQACLDFMDNKVKVFDGLFFKDIEGRMSLCLTLKFHINDLPTRLQTLKWYLDLNEGGVVHTSDELQKVRSLLDEEIGKTQDFS